MPGNTDKAHHVAAATRPADNLPPACPLLLACFMPCLQSSPLSLPTHLLNPILCRSHSLVPSLPTVRRLQTQTWRT